MRRRATRRASLAAVLLVTAGCAVTSPRIAPPMGVSTDAGADFAYSAGQGARSFAAPQSAVGPAAAEALADLGLRDLRPTRDGTVLRYEAVTTDDRSASVTIRSLGRTSHAVVRVGWFGDQALSRAILERVAVRLGHSAPEPIPDAPPSTPASNPFFSRSAVPDSVMLRDQADAAYTDRVIP
ncbi:DUF3568 family protein [Planctomyces sp. SH-PL62]|uniref:DUF3568 family protein n=1 Tax=Planctomyces sp. SH-PL62 TaxID=1636152 RepID=UPI00078D6A93|nr:DUF3568 family protein [Planctomyces sp. SH-PL62]AMV37216.1 hypothetical protein VT85_07275 [Planctomyces sp. SH-PL62]